jgi:Large eukaryotic DNA virus major capsid protein
MSSHFYSDVNKTSRSAFQRQVISFDTATRIGDYISVEIPNKGQYITNMFLNINKYSLNNVVSIELHLGKVPLFRFTGEFLFINRLIRTQTQKEILLDNNIQLPIGTLPILGDMHLMIKMDAGTGVVPVSLELSADYIYSFDDIDGKYLLEQVQVHCDTLPADFIYTGFRHSVKELFVVIQDTAQAGTFNFSNATGFDQLTTMELVLNGATKFSDTALFFRCVQPMVYHTRAPEPPYLFYMYSFALAPEMPQPSGAINMSMTKQVFNISLSDPAPKNVRIYAIGYNYLTVKDGLGTLEFMY